MKYIELTGLGRNRKIIVFADQIEMVRETDIGEKKENFVTIVQTSSHEIYVEDSIDEVIEKIKSL